MPSSYTLSLRVTLQATGENNNTWGAILNSGVFGLLDFAIAGRLAFSLSGVKNLTTANGATDEARAAFLDVAGGTGGSIVLPPVSKGYFVRNFSAGNVAISAGGAGLTFGPGDILPIFTDGATVYSLMLSSKPLKQFITDADQQIIDYVNLAISSGSIALPPAAGQLGKALMVRTISGSDAWTPSFVEQADVVGLVRQFERARAFYGDLF